MLITRRRNAWPEICFCGACGLQASKERRAATSGPGSSLDERFPRFLSNSVPSDRGHGVPVPSAVADPLGLSSPLAAVRVHRDRYIRTSRHAAKHAGRRAWAAADSTREGQARRHGDRRRRLPSFAPSTRRWSDYQAVHCEATLTTRAPAEAACIRTETDARNPSRTSGGSKDARVYLSRLGHAYMVPRLGCSICRRGARPEEEPVQGVRLLWRAVAAEGALQIRPRRRAAGERVCRRSHSRDNAIVRLARRHHKSFGRTPERVEWCTAPSASALDPPSDPGSPCPVNACPMAADEDRRAAAGRRSVRAMGQ